MMDGKVLYRDGNTSVIYDGLLVMFTDTKTGEVTEVMLYSKFQQLVSAWNGIMEEEKAGA